MTPFLLTFVFGIIETTLLLKDDAALTSAVRVGGREASAMAYSLGQDPSNSAEPLFAENAAAAITQATSAMRDDHVDALYIYLAGPRGSSGVPTSCSANCVSYTWDGTKFAYAGGSWTSASINACVNNSPDSVGVYMKVTHPFTTDLFHASMPLSDYVIFAFEPLASQDCAPGTHP